MKTKYIVGGGIAIVILLLLLRKKKKVVVPVAVIATDGGASSGGGISLPSTPSNPIVLAPAVMIAPPKITTMPVTPSTSQLINPIAISPNPLDNSGSVNVIEKRVDATTMPVGDSMIQRLENPSGLTLQTLMPL